MPRSITHEGGLRHTATEVSRFYDEIGHLQPKLAVVLVQLPPTLEFTAMTVRSFFKGLPRLEGIVVTCEPRHESWFSRAADDALRRVNVSRVAADPARCPSSDVPGGARNFAYFRWHGAPRMYYSRYANSRLASFATTVAKTEAMDSWCIFDNTARYAAWDDALRFIALVGSATRRSRTSIADPDS